MDLDELRGVQSTERQRDSLQHLRDSFYEDVAAYVASRKHRRDERAASVDNPFSDEKVRRLSDEIETAEEVVESLYERRVGKVVKLASFAAADAPVDTDGMTAEEAALFEDLVDRIERNKENVLDVLEGGADVDLDAPSGSEPSPAAGEPERPPARGATPGPSDDDATADPSDDDVLADAMGGADGPRDAGREGTPPADAHERTSPDEASNAEQAIPPDEPGPSGDSEFEREGGRTESEDVRKGTGTTDADATSTGMGEGVDDAGGGGSVDEPAGGTVEERTTVRITRDVGRILGVDDREYDLESEDVVTLPSANAGPLVDRDAAERIE